MHGLTRVALLTFLLACVGVLSGCATLTETPAERNQRWRQVARTDAGQLTEHFDLWAQTDRSSRLTRWHSR
jgi:hypothetical protein